MWKSIYFFDNTYTCLISLQLINDCSNLIFEQISTLFFWDYYSLALCNKVLDDPNYAVVPRALG